MSLSPASRPVVIKGVKVEYMTTKTDIYKNENSYFKIGRKDVEGKLNRLVIDGYKLPWFESGDGKYILKVKFKNVKITDMMKQNKYAANISFKHYNTDDNEGYYVNEINI